MRRAWTILAVAVPALVTLASATAARADETSDVESLLSQSVITTASKSAELGAAAPGTSTTMSAAEMSRLGLRTLDEAIDFLALGVMTSNPLDSVDVGVRGVIVAHDHGSHVLLLIDGHAVNETLFGSASFDRGAGIPIEIIDHIEVIIGPGSVLYGSNAMLGVINVITKRAKDFSGAQATAETTFGRAYRASVGYGRDFTLFGHAAELTAVAQYDRQDGPAFTFGPQNRGAKGALGLARFTHDGPATGIWGGVADHSYYSIVPGAFVRLRWSDWELRVAASANERARPYDTASDGHDIDFNDPNSFRRDRSLWMDLRHHVSLTSVVDVSTRLYLDLHDSLSNLNDSTIAGYVYDKRTVTDRVAGLSRAAGLEVQGSFDWWKSEAFVTLLGVDLRVHDVRSKSDVLDFDTGAPLTSSFGVIHDSGATVGVYAQQAWKPARFLSVNGGARIDVDRRFAPVPSPRLSIAVAPWEGATVKAIYARAFRAPSYFETSYSSFSQLRADGLKPETVDSGEILFEQRLGTQRVFVGAFASRWSDLVSLEPLSAEEYQAALVTGELGIRSSAAAVGRFKNLATIVDYGFNAGFAGEAFGHLRFGANVTGAVPRLTDVMGSRPLPLAPQIFGNAHVAYEIGAGLPTVGLAARVLGSRPADGTVGTRFTEAPYAPLLAEVHASVSGPMPKLAGLDYRLSATVASASRGPYVVGPQQGKDIPRTPAELSPIDQVRVALGFTYKF